MAKILVTGGYGFIGKHLVPKLVKAGHELFTAHRDIGDVAEESTWSKYPKTDVVIHLAGKTFVPDSWIDPVAYIKCNLLGTVAALNYCRIYKARIVYISSYLYGNPESLPIPETAPLVASNPYCLSKKMAEEVCRFYSDSYGVDVTILRPFNVFGPGQPENFLIPFIIRQVNAGKTIQVRDLEPKRDFVYISDLVRSLLMAVHCQRRFSIFNIGSGVSYSVTEIINIIQNLKKTDLPVISSHERRKDEIMNTVADITVAKRDLGWEPQLTFNQGLELMFKRNSHK